MPQKVTHENVGFFFPAEFWFCFDLIFDDFILSFWMGILALY